MGGGSFLCREYVCRASLRYKTNFYIYLVVALDLAGKDTTYRSDNIKFELTVSPKKKCGKERDRLFSL